MPATHPTTNDADALWQQAPIAALCLWREAGAVHWRLNRAAVEWSLGAGVTETDWRSLADSPRSGAAPPHVNRAPASSLTASASRGPTMTVLSFGRISST
mgnify:CR=1 FL=1